MKVLGRYTLSAILIIAAVVGVLWPLVGSGGHVSLLAAAAVALPVQLAAFAVLVRSRSNPNSFLFWWAAGVLARMGVVVLLGLSLSALEWLNPSVFLLTVCGLFFILLLLEPVFFSAGRETSQLAS